MLMLSFNRVFPHFLKNDLSGALSTLLKPENTVTSCDLFLPCPGNPLEQCGCRQLFNQTKNLPLIGDASNAGDVHFEHFYL